MKAANFFRIACLGAASIAVISATPSRLAAQQPDNTGANRGAQGTPSSDQQSNNATDRDLAKRIRQAIVDDKNLSSYAHNVKVIVRNGAVTLKGPVKSEDEKAAVESKATALAGADKVQDELTVKTISN